MKTIEAGVNVVKWIRNFGVGIFIAIAFGGMSFLALFEAEYRLYKMRDPLANIQYVIGVAKGNDVLTWVFTLLSNDHPVKSTDFTPE